MKTFIQLPTAVSNAPDVNITRRVTGLVLAWNGATNKHDYIAVSSTNFANADLTFTANRAHNTNALNYQLTTDAGAFLKGWQTMSNVESSLGFANNFIVNDAVGVKFFAGTLSNERMRILASNGFIGVNQIAPTALFDIKAQGALSTDVAFRVRNSVDTADLFMLSGNKQFNLADTLSSDGFTSYLSSTSGVTQITCSGNSLVLSSNFNINYNTVFHHNFQISGEVKMFLDSTGNLGVGNQTTTGNGTSQILVSLGTAPTLSIVDAFQVYASDQTSGNACFHTRSEAGHIFKAFKSAAYTPTNVTPTRTFNANATTLDELADVLGTFIADMQANGLAG